MIRNFVLITDDSYVKPTLITISSIIDNKNSKDFYVINILTTEVKEESIKILETCNRQDVKINVINAVHHLLVSEKVDKHRHVSKAALLKFYLPEIFKDIDKVLYLDSDLLVRKDISDFLNINITNHYAAVIPDTLTIKGKSYLKEYKLDENFYFNSGVMHLNLQKMREDSITEKLIEYKLNNDTHFMDQDAFNAIIGKNVVIASYKYNFLNFYYETFMVDELSKFFNEPLPPTERELYESCHIIHYGGKEKPWKDNLGRLTDIYLEQKDKTILKGEKWFLKEAPVKIIEDKFNSLLEENSQNNIAFWGASVFLKKNIKEKELDIKNVIGIIDKNPSCWGDKVCGLEIFPPEKIQDFKVEKILFTIQNNNEKIYCDVKNYLKESCKNVELLPNIFEG